MILPINEYTTGKGRVQVLKAPMSESASPCACCRRRGFPKIPGDAITIACTQLPTHPHLPDSCVGSRRPKVHKVLHIKASRRLDQASTMQGWEVLTRATCSTWQTRRIHDALQAGTTDLVPSKPQILNALLHILCCFVRFVVRDLASVVRQRISAVVRASSYKLPGYKTRFPTV